MKKGLYDFRPLRLKNGGNLPDNYIPDWTERCIADREDEGEEDNEREKKDE